MTLKYFELKAKNNSSDHETPYQNFIRLLLKNSFDGKHGTCITPLQRTHPISPRAHKFGQIEYKLETKIEPIELEKQENIIDLLLNLVLKSSDVLSVLDPVQER